MKKLLLALTIVALVASAASALDVLGGMAGVGVKQINVGSINGTSPFITYSPNAMPALQVRVGYTSNTDRDPRDNTSGTAGDTIRLGAKYNLWAAAIAPYVGAEIVGTRTIDDGRVISSSQTLTVILGAEWQVLKQASLILEWNALSMATTMNDHQVTDDSKTVLAPTITCGGILYL